MINQDDSQVYPSPKFHTSLLTRLCYSYSPIHPLRALSILLRRFPLQLQHLEIFCSLPPTTESSTNSPVAPHIDTSSRQLPSPKMLELILVVIRVVQFIFAIIVLGLTGHGKPSPQPQTREHQPLTLPSRQLWLLALAKQLHDLRLRLDPPRPPLPRPGPEILLERRARHGHFRP